MSVQIEAPSRVTQVAPHGEFVAAPSAPADEPRYCNPLATELGDAINTALGQAELPAGHPKILTARAVLRRADVENPAAIDVSDAKVVLWDMFVFLQGKLGIPGPDFESPAPDWRKPGQPRQQLPQRQRISDEDRAAAIALSQAEAKRTLAMAELNGDPDAIAAIRRILENV